MDTVAIVMRGPGALGLERLALDAARDGDAVVEVLYSGISTGTEKLLWSGRMPTFPGMGYPLVPGYEAVARVVDPLGSALSPDDIVFVPGARCYGDVRGLFGAAARRIVVPAERLAPIGSLDPRAATLLALAATARHAVAGGDPPDLIVGHGALGRLMARIVVASGGTPTVWERDAARRGGAEGYALLDPAEDPRRDYRVLCDASGDADVLDALIARAAPGAEIVLAGFYDRRPSFAFPPAFMREIRLRVAAEWRPADLAAVQAMERDGRLSLDGLITHCAPAGDAEAAYAQAFEDRACLKMILDWRGMS